MLPQLNLDTTAVLPQGGSVDAPAGEDDAPAGEDDGTTPIRWLLDDDMPTEIRRQILSSMVAFRGTPYLLVMMHNRAEGTDASSRKFAHAFIEIPDRLLATGDERYVDIYEYNERDPEYTYNGKFQDLIGNILKTVNYTGNNSVPLRHTIDTENEREVTDFLTSAFNLVHPLSDARPWMTHEFGRLQRFVDYLWNSWDTSGNLVNAFFLKLGFPGKGERYAPLGQFPDHKHYVAIVLNLDVYVRDSGYGDDVEFPDFEF